MLSFDALITVQGAAKKMTQFLHQILRACLAGLSPLMCCFSLKLLYVYEIGMKSNLKFGFCTVTHRYLLCDVTFRTIIAKFID